MSLAPAHRAGVHRWSTVLCGCQRHAIYAWCMSGRGESLSCQCPSSLPPFLWCISLMLQALHKHNRITMHVFFPALKPFLNTYKLRLPPSGMIETVLIQTVGFWARIPGTCLEMLHSELRIIARSRHVLGSNLTMAASCQVKRPFPGARSAHGLPKQQFSACDALRVGAEYVSYFSSPVTFVLPHPDWLWMSPTCRMSPRLGSIWCHARSLQRTVRSLHPGHFLQISGQLLLGRPLSVAVHCRSSCKRRQPSPVAAWVIQSQQAF